jgi:hypothetical protein
MSEIQEGLFLDHSRQWQEECRGRGHTIFGSDYAWACSSCGTCMLNRERGKAQGQTVLRQLLQSGCSQQSPAVKTMQQLLSGGSGLSDKLLSRAARFGNDVAEISHQRLEAQRADEDLNGRQMLDGRIRYHRDGRTSHFNYREAFCPGSANHGKGTCSQCGAGG